MVVVAELVGGGTVGELVGVDEVTTGAVPVDGSGDVVAVVSPMVVVSIMVVVCMATVVVVVATMHSPPVSVNPRLHSLHTSSPVQIFLISAWQVIKFSTLHRAHFVSGLLHTSEDGEHTAHI